MLQLPMLAQTAMREAVAVQTEPMTLAGVIDSCWTQIVGLSWFEAITAIAFGAILLFHGWRIYKTLVVISFAMLGLFVGMAVGERIGSALWGAIIGLFVLGFLSLPLMQWGISLLGAIAGGVLATGLWYAVSLPERYVLAGSLIGIVAGGMISFIIVKAAVMLFTSLQGAILISAGALALLAEWSETGARTREIFFDQRWFFPAMLAFFTAAGIYIQTRFNAGGDIGEKK